MRPGLIAEIEALRERVRRIRLDTEEVCALVLENADDVRRQAQRLAHEDAVVRSQARLRLTDCSPPPGGVNQQSAAIGSPPSRGGQSGAGRLQDRPAFPRASHEA